MTVQEIIDKVNILRRNNPFTIKDVMRWLNQCEARIQRECLLMPKVVAVYDAKIDAEENVLAVPPYDELYVYYICAKIDEALGEEERYNNTITRYNDVHKDYQRYLIKKYDPAHKKVRIVRDDPVIYQGDRVEITLYELPATAEEITSAKAVLTQGESVKEITEVTALENTLSFVLTEAESYSLNKGALNIGYDIEAGGYRYKDIESRKFYVKLAPELQIIAEGTSGSPVDASLTIAGRAADAAATGTAIEKRSAEFGLGKRANELPAITDANSATANGWYNISADTLNGVGVNAVMRVDAMRASAVRQTAFSADYSRSYNLLQVREMYNDGTWSEWEWETPPMIAGVEYRTTERWDGKPVYKKRITYTHSGTFGNESTFADHNIAHGISNFGTLIKCSAIANNQAPLPFSASGGGVTSVNIINSADITVRVVKDTWTNPTFVFDLEYTKS